MNRVMDSSILEKLPAVSAEKTGWPWTESSQLPADLEAVQWPRITIVTPSYQQGKYVEETIRSVLLQNYPNLEYFVLDGASTDGSAEIIEQYAPWLDFWVSEKDGGQVAAINRGFARASGEILGWLNSDDVLTPDTLFTVARYFLEHPDCQFVYGDADLIDGRSIFIKNCAWIQAWDKDLFISKDFITQPAAFWRRSLWQQTGNLDNQYGWGFDWDWFIRAGQRSTPRYLRQVFALARITHDTKTMSGGSKRRAEVAAIARRHGGFMQPTNLIWLARRLGETIEEKGSWLPSFIYKRSRWLYYRLKNHYQGRYQE